MIFDLLTGFVIATPIAVMVRQAGHVTVPGAVIGVVVAAISYAAFYLAGFAVLGSALIVTIAASRLRRRRTSAPDPAQDDEDTRGAANIVANCLVGTIGAVLELTGLVRPELTALCFVAGITAGASDTVASELGRAFGGRPRRFPTWKTAVPGTAGAVTALGTVAGIVSAGIIAAPAAVLWLLPIRAVFVVIIAAAAGSLVESALATAFEARGLVGNHTLNLLNTSSSAAMAVLFVALA